MTTFEEAAALTRLDDDRWSATFPADWAQGRTMFGGLQAALATTVAQEVAGPERPLRTLDVGFVAPMTAGPGTLEAEVLGSGRSATSAARPTSTQATRAATRRDSSRYPPVKNASAVGPASSAQTAAARAAFRIARRV